MRQVHVVAAAVERFLNLAIHSMSIAEYEDLRHIQHPLVDKHFGVTRDATGAPCDEHITILPGHAIIHAQPQAGNHEQPQASHPGDDTRETSRSLF